MATLQYNFTDSSEMKLDRNNNTKGKAPHSRGSKNYEKYSLRPRSIQNRIETDKRRKEEKKEPKPKQKPPPLSKYRRKTANARERTRMNQINHAFESLQRAVPQYPILPVNSSGKTCEKLTKITTLRLAMNYIEALKTLLNPSMESDDFSSGTSACSPASSYTMSPLSSPPECIQTVMRSVVSPSSFASSPSSSCSSSSSSSSCSSSSAVSNSFASSSSPVPPLPKIINNHHHHHHHSNNSHRMSTKGLVTMSPRTVAECLPPPMSILSAISAAAIPNNRNHSNHVNINNCSSSNSNSNCNSGNTSNNRTGSLSSLTESDLSEYTSDLLSDEGSTLDDPMFEDLIGVGAVASDFPDLLLDSDGDSLHFSSDLSDN